MSTLRESLEQYVVNCVAFGDEPMIEDLKLLLDKYPAPAPRCGKKAQLHWTPMYTDWSGECIMTLNAEGTHRGLHQDKAGNMWDEDRVYKE